MSVNDGITIAKEEYRRWQKDKAHLWQQMARERKVHEAAEARAVHLDKVADAADDDEDGYDGYDARALSLQRGLGTFVDVVGDDRVPFTPSAFLDGCRKACGVPADDLCTGLGCTRYAPLLRDRHCEGLFVRDSGSIRKDARFRVLGALHPVSPRSACRNRQSGAQRGQGVRESVARGHVHEDAREFHQIEDHCSSRMAEGDLGLLLSSARFWPQAVALCMLRGPRNFAGALH